MRWVSLPAGVVALLRAAGVGALLHPQLVKAVELIGGAEAARVADLGEIIACIISIADSRTQRVGLLGEAMQGVVGVVRNFGTRPPDVQESSPSVKGSSTNEVPVLTKSVN